MRIGMIAPPWIPVPPRAYGGIEAVVDSLSRSLADAGHEVVLAAPGDSSCPVERIPGFAPSDRVPIGDAAAERLHVARAYSALAEVDVIHDHTVPGLGTAYRTGAIPVVTTAHGPFLPPVTERFLSAPADTAVVAISHNQASMAGPVRIARVIHHGLDPAGVPIGRGDGGFACFLGRMHPDKGVRQAILIARRAGIPLMIAAKMREPGETEYFHSAIRPMLGAGAEYLGELDSADKYALLGQAMALLNPIQWNEPFGMVMIESLATGTPVVGTPRGSAPEIIDDNRSGFLRTGMRHLVGALSRAGELDRRFCRRVVEERFSATRMAAAHLDLYSALVQGAAAPEDDHARDRLLLEG